MKPERSKKPLQFYCVTLPWKQLRSHPDIGDYQMNADNSPAVIGTADTGDDISNFAILIHEEVEAMWCWLNGVKEETVTEFDRKFFARQENGEEPPDAAPGDAEGCPYGEGHFMAEAVERFVLEHFGMMWATHEQNCGNIK